MELRDFAVGIVYLNENGKKNQTGAALLLKRFFDKTAALTPSDDAFKKWITPSEKSKRNCNVKSYYPEPILSDNKKLALIMFIRTFGEKAAFRCQKEFRRIISERNDKDCVNDTETGDYDILCFSILNQLIVLMGMDALRIDDPALKIDPEIVELVIERQKQEEEKRKLETISKAKLKVAEETAEIEYERIALEEEVQKERERVAAEEKARKEHERLEAEMIAHPQSTLAVPPEYNFCGFCKNWQSMSDSDNDALAVDGKCKIFKHTVLSTTENCDNFTPHFGRINHSYFGKSFPNHSGKK